MAKRIVRSGFASGITRPPLRRERMPAMQGAKEMAHESLGPENPRPAAAPLRFQGRRVQNVALAETEATVDEKKGNRVVLAFCNRACSAGRKFVGPADDQCLKRL